MKNPREFPANWDLRAQKNYRLGHDAIFFLCVKETSFNRLEWMTFFNLSWIWFDQVCQMSWLFSLLFWIHHMAKGQRAEPWILEFRKRFTRRVCFGDSVSSSTGFLRMCAGGPRWWNLCCAIEPWILCRTGGNANSKVFVSNVQQSCLVSHFFRHICIV